MPTPTASTGRREAAGPFALRSTPRRPTVLAGVQLAPSLLAGVDPLKQRATAAAERAVEAGRRVTADRRDAVPGCDPGRQRTRTPTRR